MHTLWLAKTLPSGISLWRLPCKKWIFRQRSALINGKCIAHSSGSAGLPLHLHNYKSYYWLGGGMVRISHPHCSHTQFNFISMHSPFFCALQKYGNNWKVKPDWTARAKNRNNNIYYISQKRGDAFFFFGAWQSANETATIGCSLIDW